MKQPKHLSDEAWAVISNLENKIIQFRLGFGDPGDSKEFNGFTFKFIGNFKRKKDADALKSETVKVNGYLDGKLKRGWAVIEVTPIA